MASIYAPDGSAKGSAELPRAFSEPVRKDLILRAIHAEESLERQPQGHSIKAGMQTSAAYFGKMHSYRSGRHMGMAIRPREKLGGGVQGKVKRIPSATKGRRAHPHKVEKTIVERINAREYQKAIASAVAATAKAYGTESPIILSNAVEEISRTRDMTDMLLKFKLSEAMARSKVARVNTSKRYATRRHFKHMALLVISKNCAASKAARNIPGVSVCTLDSLTAGKLAPGGTGIVTLWSEDAIKGLDEAIAKLSLNM